MQNALNPRRHFGAIASYFVLGEAPQGRIEWNGSSLEAEKGLPRRNDDMPRPHAHFSASRKGSAFSLIEVVLALGVVSFAMVGLVGLLPVGLSVSRQAIDVTIQSQMAQTLRNQVQLGGLTNVDQWAGQQLYFDNQGLQVSGVGAPSRVYTAQMTVTNVVEQDKTAAALSLPATAARMVVVTVTSTAAAGTTNVFPIIVTRNGS